MIILTEIYKDVHIDFIYHLADIHIPNDNARHPEYRLVFDSLYTKLKNNKNTKPLFNTQILARNIEKAYSLMYERYLKNLPLDNLEVN